MVEAPLTFGDCIKGYATPLLRRMVASWGLRPMGGRAGMTRSLLGALSDAARVEEQFARLGPAARAAVAAAGACPHTFLSLGGWLAGSGYASPVRTLEQLIEAGLLLVLPGAHHQRLLDNAGDLAASFFHASRLSLGGAVEPDPPELELAALDETRLESIELADASLLQGALARFRSVLASRPVRVDSRGRIGRSQLGVVEREVGSAVPLPVLLWFGQRGGFLSFDDKGVLRPVEPAAWPEPGLPLARALLATYRFDAASLASREPDYSDDELYAHGGLALAGPTLRQAALAAVRRARGFVDLDDLLLQITLAHPRLAAPRSLDGTGPDSYFYAYAYRRAGMDASLLDGKAQVRRHEWLRRLLTTGLRRLGLVDVARRKDAAELGPILIGEAEPALSRKRGEKSGPARLPASQRLAASGLAVRASRLLEELLARPGGPLSGQGDELCGFVVGADFEVVAPLDRTPPAVLARLGVLGRPLGDQPADPVRRFRLDRASVQSALPLIPGETMRADLARAQGGLPANVARSLEDWSRGFGEIKVLLDWDLHEHASAEERDAALPHLPGAVPVAERFLLAAREHRPSPQKSARGDGGCQLIDYAGPPKRGLTVEPDLRVRITPQRSDLLVAAELERVATPHPDGDGFILDRDRTAASGLGAKALGEWFQRRTVKQPPPFLGVLLRAWCGKKPVLHLGQATLLQAHDEAEAEALLTLPGVASAVVAPLGGGALLVRPEARPALEAALGALGISTDDAFGVRRGKTQPPVTMPAAPYAAPPDRDSEGEEPGDLDWDGTEAWDDEDDEDDD